jgi:hypothetical protein
VRGAVPGFAEGAVELSMSALPPKADMCGAQAHVCFGPIADMTASFDYFVGSVQQTKWHSDAQHFGGLEINH